MARYVSVHLCTTETIAKILHCSFFLSMLIYDLVHCICRLALLRIFLWLGIWEILRAVLLGAGCLCKVQGGHGKSKAPHKHAVECAHSSQEKQSISSLCSSVFPSSDGEQDPLIQEVSRTEYAKSHDDSTCEEEVVEEIQCDPSPYEALKVLVVSLLSPSQS